MKKPMAIATSCVLIAGLLAGCSQAERASYNLSKEADNHFVGLSDNVTYVIEDVEGADVENTEYTLNFNPDMWIPVGVKTIK